MDYETFVTTVAELARTDRAGTERAIRATLQTLAEHVTREEARQVAGLLPVELGPWLHTGSWGAQRGGALELASLWGCGRDAIGG